MDLENQILPCQRMVSIKCYICVGHIDYGDPDNVSVIAAESQYLADTRLKI